MVTGMKLFVVRLHEGGPILEGPDGKPLYFTSKAVAKTRRDKSKGMVISLGPDHRNFKTIRG
mgnify:CR=1 FL=1